MITPWLLQMLFTYGSIKISKSVLKKTIDKKKRLKHEKERIKLQNKYKASLLDTEGNIVAAPQETDNLEEIIKWSKQYSDEPTVKTTMSEVDENGIILEPDEKFVEKEIEFTQQSIDDLISDFEKQKEKEAIEVKTKQDILEKREIFTPEEKEIIEDDIVRFFYNNGHKKEAMKKELDVNKEINNQLDDKLKELSVTGKFKLKNINPKFLGNKNDIESTIGFYQNLIIQKTELFNYIASTKGIDVKFVLPSKFVSQQQYKCDQNIPLVIKSNNKSKVFNFDVDSSQIFQEKSQSVMNFNEVKEWRKSKNKLIQTTLVYATKEKYDRSKLHLYASKALDFEKHAEKGKMKKDKKQYLKLSDITKKEINNSETKVLEQEQIKTIKH